MLISLEVWVRWGLSDGHRLVLKWPGYLPSCDEGGSLLMGLVKHTIGISRADLTRDCLQELRLWPGCGTVESVAVLGDMHGRFTIHVVNYGLYGLKIKHVADRAVRCIQREKLRHFHLKIE